MNDISATKRASIIALEQAIHNLNDTYQLDEPVLPLVHHFAPGAYGREMLIPKGTLVVGKIHKHAHLNFVIQGHVSVKTEDGVVEYTAPQVFVSNPGTKRVVYAHEDTRWVTVHVTASTDLTQIEDEVIARSFKEYDEFRAMLPNGSTEPKEIL